MISGGMAAGLIVALSGAASAVFVVMVNAWMNAPAGVVIEAGRIVRVDVLAGMQSPVAFAQVVHMLLAAYAVGARRGTSATTSPGVRADGRSAGC